MLHLLQRNATLGGSEGGAFFQHDGLQQFVNLLAPLDRALHHLRPCSEGQQQRHEREA